MSFTPISKGHEFARAHAPALQCAAKIVLAFTEGQRVTLRELPPVNKQCMALRAPCGQEVIMAFVKANEATLRENTSLLERARELSRAIAAPAPPAVKTYLRHAGEPAGVTFKLSDDKGIVAPITGFARPDPISKKSARKAEAIARSRASKVLRP